MKKTAVIAMSGGIDSSLSALLLQQQGYNVVGLTGKMLNSKSADIVCENAKKVADKLGIEHYVFDATEIFKEKVVDYFVNSYEKGETPNPCVMCNQFVKWGVLFDYAFEKLNADVFATGHYADIRFNDGVYKLYPANDEHKDQLYFLYRLGQKQLSKTIFPLGKYTKDEVKKLAHDFDLPMKDSKESQDICFIERPNTTKKYLVENFGSKRGDFVDISTGKKLGEHDGSYLYTIGQRKGIGLSAPRPLYVTGIDAQKNIVYLGYAEDNYRKKLAIKNVNLTYPYEKKEFEAFVKVRYNMQMQKAKCKMIDDCIEIEFEQPISSVASGQAGVLYDIENRHLLGGGTITLL